MNECPDCGREFIGPEYSPDEIAGEVMSITVDGACSACVQYEEFERKGLVW